MTFTGMRRDLLLSLLDQGLLSAFNLGLSIVLIALTTPAEFGHFVVLFASSFVLLSVQSALVVAPLNFLLPGRPEAEQMEKVSLLTSINALLCVLGVVAGALLYAVYPYGDWLYVAVPALFVSALLRDYGRNLFIVRGEMARTLMLDGLSVVLSAVIGVVLWQILDPVTAAIGGLAAGNLLSVIVAGPDTKPRFGRMRPLLLNYRSVWTETRWALMGAMVSEGQIRSYVYVVEAWKGVSTLGAVQAGRTLLSPLTLCATAWARIARPRMVASIYDRREHEVVPLARQGVLIVAMLGLVYGGTLVGLWPQLERFVFRDKYPDMELIVLLWWIHTCVTSVNYVVATVLQARRQFRDLAVLGGVAAIIAVSGLLGLSRTGLAVEYALAVLIVTELLELSGQIWLIARGRMHQPVPA